jgi:hypothetical protein
MLPEPSFGSTYVNPHCSTAQRTNMYYLQGVLNTYAMLQRELEAAAIALVRPRKDEGISIRDRIVEGRQPWYEHYWHLEVSKIRRVGMERSVRHTGVRSWVYNCGACIWKTLSGKPHCARHNTRFTIVSLVVHGGPVFFCKETRETVQNVNGEFRDLPPTLAEEDKSNAPSVL